MSFILEVLSLRGHRTPERRKVHEPIRWLYVVISHKSFERRFENHCHVGDTSHQECELDVPGSSYRVKVPPSGTLRSVDV